MVRASATPSIHFSLVERMIPPLNLPTRRATRDRAMTPDCITLRGVTAFSSNRVVSHPRAGKKAPGWGPVLLWKGRNCRQDRRGSLLYRVQFFADLGQEFEVSAGGFGDGLGAACFDGGEVDEVAADAEGACSGAEEALSGFESDAAGGDELEVGEGREKGFEVAGAADCGAGKDFHVVRAGLPGGDDFSGRKRAGDGELPAPFCFGDDLRMEAGANDELSAGFDGGSGLRGGGDGAGAEQELRSVFSLEFFQYIQRAGDGHGDFDDRDAAGDHGFDDGVGLGGRASAEDGNEADALDDLCRGFGHGFFTLSKYYRRPVSRL